MPTYDFPHDRWYLNNNRDAEGRPAKLDIGYCVFGPEQIRMLTAKERHIAGEAMTVAMANRRLAGPMESRAEAEDALDYLRRQWNDENVPPASSQDTGLNEAHGNDAHDEKMSGLIDKSFVSDMLSTETARNDAVEVVEMPPTLAMGVDLGLGGDKTVVVEVIVPPVAVEPTPVVVVAAETDSPAPAVVEPAVPMVVTEPVAPAPKATVSSSAEDLFGDDDAPAAPVATVPTTAAIKSNKSSSAKNKKD